MICECKIEMATFRTPGTKCPHCGKTVPLNMMKPVPVNPRVPGNDSANEVIELYDGLMATMLRYHEGRGRNRERLNDLWDATQINAKVLSLLLGTMVACPFDEREAEQFRDTTLKSILERFRHVRHWNAQNATPVKWEN